MNSMNEPAWTLLTSSRDRIQPAVVPLLIIVATVYLLNICIHLRRVAQSIDNWPGRRTLLNIELLINRFLPAIPGVLLSADYSWTEHYGIYHSIGWDVHSTLSFWPKSHAALWLADADTVKEVISSRTRYPKPTELYKVLKVFGPNIIAAEDEDWKRFRKICSPAFSERNSRHVWDATFLSVASILDDCLTHQNDDHIIFENTNDLTLPIALAVLAIAGLGQPVGYVKRMDRIIVDAGHRISFRQALEVVAHDLWIKIGISPWMYILHPRFRKLRAAFDELEVYLRGMIVDYRMTGNPESKADLFNLLLEANSESSSSESLSLTDEELLGNLFTFILGGHEGTAYTLCFALGALALYEEVQEMAFQEVSKAFCGDKHGEQTPPYEAMSSLPYILGVIYETLRMFPPVSVIPKYSAGDTILSTTNKEGVKKLIPVPKNTRVLIHTTGLHFNPRYWEDPETFNPGRFLDSDWPRHAFIPFGAGSRSCLGRKFFETESVAALSYIVEKYKISVKEEHPLETFDQKKARIFRCRNILTLTPDRIPLVFTRRK